MKVAVIGSGIAGISASYDLKKNGHHVEMFEAGDYLGGHTHTHQIEVGGKSFPVDSGFLVHNDVTYPNLIEFFKELNIRTHPSDMSFSVINREENIEWGAGANFMGMFCQKFNLIRPKFYRMMLDILRFNRNAKKYLAMASDDPSMTLGDLLAAEGFSRAFTHWFLLPMGGCIWSTPIEEMQRYPAETFLRFCMNHGLLQIFDQPKWKTIVGGCNQYTLKVAERLDAIHLNAPVVSILPSEKRVLIITPKKSMYFDKVFVATHAPQTVKMLESPVFEEALKVLSQFEYQPNRAVMHTDSSFLPKSKSAWSSWNYFAGRNKDNESAVSCTYLINMLQPLPVKTPIMVTLNPLADIDPSKVIKTMNYEHPLFDKKAIAAQSKMPGIQGTGGVYFCGAWMRYGFHEDGIWSAKQALNAFNHHVGDSAGAGNPTDSVKEEDLIIHERAL